MTGHPSLGAQAAETDFALHTLGWKAFQDLAVAVAAEVLKRPVQMFLPSQDGGRDGAFVGTWPGAPDEPDAKSTIQCKSVGKAGATLKLGDVSAELSKIATLTKRGLTHDYILLTNAGISGESEAQIVAAFEEAGAKRARVFGRDWLTHEIRARPRLRMMVPRLYGLGDLSQIIDERAYLQARYILSAMGDDLAAFVTTGAHRQSVEALRHHRFVLLLGDPASGKSTIGASLALGALDDGAIGTMRISDGEGFERHWNPGEPSQFFWIDDAFGETQYSRERANGWNSRLKLLRAAVKAGARVLMTSRTYIWKAAQRDLKLSEFPLFTNSQVIIDVQGLSDIERAQILYNHVRRGDQPSEWREELKYFLPAIATNRHFLPETARRLGSTFFTGSLALTAEDITAFVEAPVVFLKDVLRSLSEPDLAAVALIFLHGPSGVASPIPASDELDTVCRLTGVGAADVARAMEALQGSVTLLRETEEGRRWVFKHPTIADAYAELVADSPEMVELYVRGAKLEKLRSEVVCGTVALAGASVHVPPTLFPVLLERIAEKDLFSDETLRFAVYRADPQFMALLVERMGDLSDVPQHFGSDMRWNAKVSFIAAIHPLGLLPEAVRRVAVERISYLTMLWADVVVFRDEVVRDLFAMDELSELDARFNAEIVKGHGQNPEQWEDRLSSSYRVQHLEDLKEGIEVYAAFRADDEELRQSVEDAVSVIDRRIEVLNDEPDEEEPENDAPIAPATPVPPQIASIFDDVDD